MPGDPGATSVALVVWLNRRPSCFATFCTPIYRLLARMNTRGFIYSALSARVHLGQAWDESTKMDEEMRFMFDLEGFVTVPDILDAETIGRLNAVLDEHLQQSASPHPTPALRPWR